MDGGREEGSEGEGDEQEKKKMDGESRAQLVRPTVFSMGGEGR